MIKKVFVDHPESVGESYFEHLGVSFGFGFKLLGAALACMIHGLVPCLFTSTGSATIKCLHERMVTNRIRHAKAPAPIAQPGEAALS